MSNVDLVFESVPSHSEERSISTAQAARMLGMSLTSVQKLVDQAEVHAWKTPGGHRRIDLASIRGYQNKSYISPALSVKTRSMPVLKVIVEDAGISAELKRELDRWSSTFDVSLWTSMPEAFLSFASQAPDILIVQMSMPLNQQIKTVLALEKFNERGRRSLSVVCLGCAKELDAKVKNEVSASVQILPQSLDTAWLQAFLTGAVASASISAARRF